MKMKPLRSISCNSFQSMSKYHVTSLRYLRTTLFICTGLSRMWIRQHKQSISPVTTPKKSSYILHLSLTISPTTDTTASFDVSLSQYVKTNTGSTYQPFTVTAFHSTKNKHL